MEYLKTLIFSFSFLLAGMTLTSCGSSTSEGSIPEKEGKEYTSAYICPMHCEGSGSDAAGTCPVCKMDYVKNDSHNHDGHNH